MQLQIWVALFVLDTEENSSNVACRFEKPPRRNESGFFCRQDARNKPVIDIEVTAQFRSPKQQIGTAHRSIEGCFQCPSIFWACFHWILLVYLFIFVAIGVQSETSQLHLSCTWRQYRVL